MVSQLIKNYYETKELIESSVSPKGKFTAIVNFFRKCEELNHFPPSPSFLHEFLPILLRIIQNYSINFIEPVYLKSAKLLLDLSSRLYDDEVVPGQIHRAIEYINLQLLKTYFYLGEQTEGINLLSSMINEPGAAISEEETVKQHFAFQKSKYAIVTHDTFRQIRAIEIMKELKDETERINSYSDSEVNVLLVEGDTGAAMLPGMIQPLRCEINAGSGKIELQNNTELSETDFTATLEMAKAAAQKLCSQTGSGCDFRKLSVNLSYGDFKGIYRGKSFLLAAGIVLFCSYLNYRNKRIRFEISSSSAFSGALEPDGRLQKLPLESLQAKLKAAFYSWIRTVVIPAAHKEEAKEIITLLKKEHPNKNLKLIAIEHVTDILKYPEVMKLRMDSFYEHGKKVLKRHSAVSVAAGIVIALLLGTVAAYKLIPREIKPLPHPGNDMYVMYAPDRDTQWIFHNNNFFSGDTIDFGEVAIGDYWAPKVELWNNGRSPLKISADIEGKDKDEFEVLWRNEPDQLDAPEKVIPDKAQRLFIKFIPFKNEGLKEAVLVFSAEGNNEMKKRVYLRGTAKRYNRGYSLMIGDGDDNLIFEPGANLLKDDFTFQIWMKPASDVIKNLKYNSHSIKFDNNPLTNNKFGLGLTRDTGIVFTIFGRKADANTLQTPLLSRGKVKLNEWNYVAVGHSRGKFYLVLNDGYDSLSLGENSVRAIEDCIYFGQQHPSQRGKVIPDTVKGSMLYDEFKIWNVYIPAEKLIKDRFSSGSDKGLIVHYDFDEATAGKIFDTSPNDYWSDLFGGVKRVIDNPSSRDGSVTRLGTTHTEKTNTVLRIDKKGLMKFSKNIFKQATSFTIQMDAKVLRNGQGKQTDLMHIMQPDADMQFQFSYYDSIYLGYRNPLRYSREGMFKYSLDTNWHRYTFSYSEEQNTLSLFIDGKMIAALDSLAPFDISRYFWGISFGNYALYGAPRYYGETKYLDNIKIYNRMLNADEMFSENQKGPLAYWTFENTDKELVYDEINHLPAFLWEDYELVSMKLGF